VEPEAVVYGQLPQRRRAEPDDVHPLGPAVVRRLRDEDDRRAERVAGEALVIAEQQPGQPGLADARQRRFERRRLLAPGSAERVPNAKVEAGDLGDREVEELERRQVAERALPPPG